MTFISLPIGQIQPLKKSAHIDKRYGPYINVSTALAATKDTRDVGLTVAILSDQGGVVEYQYKNGITDDDLIVKDVYELKQEILVLTFQNEYSIPWTAYLSNYFGHYPTVKVFKSIDATTWILLNTSNISSFTYDSTGAKLQSIELTDNSGVSTTYKVVLQR